MKTVLPILLSLVAAAAIAGEPTKLTYEKNDAVWVAGIDGSGARKIAGGQSPCLSPDGSKLAFNTVQQPGQPAHRQIAVADLAKNAITVFKDIPSENCMEPVWSPDGSKLLFYYYTDNERRIGLVNADGSGFRYVQKSEPKHAGYWAAAWAADGKSFFCEDMENLYHLDLDATVLKKWNIEKLVPKGGMSGDVRLDVSPDGKTLLMDIEMAETERKGWDGPPPAVWKMDLATEKVARVTPKSLYAWDCHWCGPDAIVFCSQAAGEESPSIYRMSLEGNGEDRKLLVKNARLPGVSP